MPTARTCTAALLGAEAHLIEVEGHLSNGPPATILVGLPDSSLRETRDRVYAAIRNSGEQWPATKISLGLSPASLPKQGSALDLAIAVCILAAAGTVPAAAAGRPVLFYAELGLDGALRPVPGVLPAVMAAVADGVSTAVVAEANAAEASHAPGAHVVPARSLADVVAWLRTGHQPPPPSPATTRASRPARHEGDWADVRGQDAARRAAEICAAGGHSLSLLGPPGSGTALLAERLPLILPDLDQDAALEVTSLHSLAGIIPDAGLITRPPFMAPHHTASLPAIVGGGSGGILRPGAVSLAHRGILFLRDAPEFSRAVCDSLRQPLATGQVVIARGGVQGRFPARFCLVQSACPCPCTAVGGAPENCSCTPVQRRRYLQRAAGLTDAIDLKVPMTTPGRAHGDPGEPTAVVRDRVEAARERARHRLAGTPWRLNADIPAAELRRAFRVEPGASREIQRATDLGWLSERGTLRALRVAWTIADLAGHDRPTAEDCALALALMKGDPASG